MRIMAIIVALALAGCAGGPQIDHMAQARADATANRTRDLDACQQRYPRRERGKTADSLRCVMGVQEKYAWIEGMGLNKDLAKLATVKSVEAGERYDHGQITDAQLDVEIAAILAEFVGQSQQRLAQSALADAARDQAQAAQDAANAARSAALLQAGTTLLTQPPPPAPPTITNTNCNTFGNTLNCTSMSH